MNRFLYYTETFCSLSETFVYRLAKCFIRYSPVVLTHHRSNEEQYPADGISIIVHPPFGSGRWRRKALGIKNAALHGLFLGDVAPIAEVAKMHHNFNFKLLFAQFGNCGMRLLPAARHLDLPLVITFQGCDAFNWCSFPFYRRNLKTLFSYSRAHFCVPSRFLAERLQSLGCPSDRITVFRNPIPLWQKNTNRSDDGPIKFLHAGRLVQKKGIIHTIRAFAMLERTNPETRLTIIGGGPEEAGAKALCQQLAVAGKVSFLGPVPYEVVEREIGEAHVFVLHSVTAGNGDREGLPTVIGEAMSSGLPIVSTWHAGIPEVVQNEQSGCLVAERDEDAMANAMIKLAASSALRESFGRKGTLIINQEFLAEHARNILEGLFDRLIASREVS